MKGRSATRLERLREMLERGGTMKLAEAAELCGVSEMTIRRDVAASNGTMTFLGGRLVMANDPQFALVYNLDEQEGNHPLIKKRLGQRAASLVEEGDTLFVDCGTTLIPMLAALDREMHLTVVTYALNIANVVAHLPNVQLLLLGGLYHPSSSSFESEEMNQKLSRLGINKAFLSAAGVDAYRGVSCFHFHEVAPKQAALKTASQSILVADSSKFGVIRPAFFASLSQFDIIVTDKEAAQPLDALAQKGAPRLLLV